MSEQEKPKRDIRQEIIDSHCENQQCVGCPKEFECDEADAEREAHEEEAAYSEYDGDEYDY